MGISGSDSDRREKFGKKLQEQVSASDRAKWISDMALTTWADESLKITIQPGVQYCTKVGKVCQYSSTDPEYWESDHGAVQSNIRTVEAGDRYEDRYDAVVKERLQQAGVRLGALLNDIFK